MALHIPHEALVRIQVEFLEMPGLKLTVDQIGRLCGLTRDVSEAALLGLTLNGFLRRAQDGTFLRSGAQRKRAEGGGQRAES